MILNGTLNHNARKISLKTTLIDLIVF